MLPTRSPQFDCSARLRSFSTEELLVRGLYGGFFHNETLRTLDPNSKWFDPHYPALAYPPYANGATYFVSGPWLAWLRASADAGVLETRWKNEDVSLGTWLAGTVVRRFHDEGVLRCLDCEVASYHQDPWVIHIHTRAQIVEERDPAHRVRVPNPREARMAFLRTEWARLQRRLSEGKLLRGECCQVRSL